MMSMFIYIFYFTCNHVYTPELCYLGPGSLKELNLSACPNTILGEGPHIWRWAGGLATRRCSLCKYIKYSWRQNEKVCRVYIMRLMASRKGPMQWQETTSLTLRFVRANVEQTSEILRARGSIRIISYPFVPTLFVSVHFYSLMLLTCQQGVLLDPFSTVIGHSQAQAHGFC